MSTYQPSTVNPAYFEVPTFESPNEFLFQISRQKQLQFDRGINEVKAQYQSMANLPVSSQIGLAKRDAYMKEASEKLRRVAGADFSLEENRSIASQVYKPMTTDSDILIDLAETKRGQRELSRIDSIKNSKDEKIRSQYWDTGNEYVVNSIRKFQSAKTSEELKQSKIREYVPYVDVIARLNKSASDLKLKISLDAASGGYIVTKENGEPANIPFYLFAQSQMGTQEREVFKVLGTVEADRRIQMETFRNGGDEVAARQMLAREAVTQRYTDLTDQIEDSKKVSARLDMKREALIKANGNVIDDKIVNQLAEIDDQKEMIIQKTSTIEDRLRDLGYDKFQGQFIENANLGRTMDYFSRDLSIPYSEQAAKNITANWAAGLATATTGLKLQADPNFAKALDLQMEQIKASVKLKEESDKAIKESTKKSKEEVEEKENNVNEPLQVGENVFGRERMKDYDLFVNMKKNYEHGLYGYGVDFIQESGIELSADFLTALADNMKDGAATEAINGKSRFSFLNRPEFQEDLKKIDEMYEKGELTGSRPDMGKYIYSDLFENLVNRAQHLTEEKMKSPGSDLESVKRLKLLSAEVNDHLSAFRVFKEDEDNIKKKVIAAGKYDLLFDKENNRLSKEEVFKNITGSKSKAEFLQKVRDLGMSISDETIKALPESLAYALDHPLMQGLGKATGFGLRAVLDKIAQMGTENFIAVNHLRPILNSISDTYDKQRATFDKKFEEFVNTEKPRFFSKTMGPNGEVGYVYPVNQWQIVKNPTTGERELGEVILRKAFNAENSSNEMKIVNMEQLGNENRTMEVVRALQGTLQSDITPDVGVVLTTTVGSDNKNPSVIFKPSVEFLKQFVSKGNPLDDKDLKKIAEYGIEVATDIPEVAKYKPSLVGRLIDIDKKYTILPELKSQGFAAHVTKMTNNRGYKVTFDYKTYDQNGNEITEVGKEMGFNVPESRLDSLAKATMNDLLQHYFNYMTQKKEREKAATANTPIKTYTEEEYQIYRKTRQ